MINVLWEDENTLPVEELRNCSISRWFETTSDPHVDARRKAILQEWHRLPDWARPEFRSRLRGKETHNLYSAVAELHYMKWLGESGFDCNLVKAVEDLSTPDIEIGLGGSPFAFAECHINGSDESNDVARFLFRVEQFITNRRIRYKYRFNFGKKQPSARAVAQRIEENAQGHRCGTTVEVEMPGSDWRLELRVELMEEPASIGVPLGRPFGEFVPWRGDELLTKILKRKRKQHRTQETPVVACLAWNDFLHRMKHLQVCDLLRERVSAMQIARVCGVFFVEGLFPWATPITRPCFYHWGDALSEKIAGSWYGESANLRC